MRKLIVITLVLAGLWAGYWYVGAQATERAFGAWIDDRQEDGWVAEVETLSTRGFPNRFDTIFTNLELADPETGLAWTAPEFQILALSYKPHHVIAVWPGVQTLSTPRQRIEMSGNTARGSLVLSPTPALALDRSSVVLEGLKFKSTHGWTAALEHGQLATRRLEGDQNRHEVYFEATNLTPASSFIQSLGPDDILPPVFEGVVVKATVDFTKPWDRFAIEDARPQIAHVNLQEFKATWGELELRLAGAVDVDENGVPDGNVTVKAQNWRKMVAIAQTSGALSPDLAPTVTGALEFLAGLSGNNDTLDIPLRLSGGTMFLGPLPIGKAPVLLIR
ncbi:DUF2125 domain-containing protein [Aliiroseovarius sp. 2305UL8-7]|uniref:DUF2125 domain-containing protein n=1 Tax=Aliiroseovarius conchicola TaxID=3121637 RepID=UPI0035286293